MNLYVKERNGLLRGFAKPAWSKSIPVRLQGFEAGSAFSLASPLFAFCGPGLRASAKHHESQARQSELDADQYRCKKEPT